MSDEKPADSAKKAATKVNLWLKGDPDLRVNVIAESVQDKTFKADSSLRTDVKKEDRKSK